MLFAAGLPAADLRVIEGRLEEPTARYGHNVLDGNEYARLRIVVERAGGATERVIDLPAERVFEDVEARPFDLFGAGMPQAVAVVESSTSGGAELVVYAPAADALARYATAPIGRRNRWLAPAGIADLDGDGRVDFAYVDRPHLAGILRIVTLDLPEGAFRELASAPGFSNHRIGEGWILSALRDCGDGPEIVLPDFAWSEFLVARLDAGRIVAERTGIAPGRRALDLLARCEPA